MEGGNWVVHTFLWTCLKNIFSGPLQMHALAEVTLIQVLLMNCMGSTKKGNVNFPKYFSAKTVSPFCWELGCFVPGGTGTEKGALESSVAIHLSPSLTRLVPRWLLSGSALVCPCLGWSRCSFQFISYLKPLHFHEYKQAALCFSLVTMLHPFFLE